MTVLYSDFLLAPPRLKRTTWRVAKDCVHSIQDQLARWHGRPGSGMLTDLRLNGRPVVFIHNPKAGGTSLGRHLGVTRRSHVFPRERLSKGIWEETFSIVVVREPFERFLSCYYGNVLRPGETGLTKRYGEIIKRLDPFSFLEVILDNPRIGGSQLNWTDFPSTLKPRADLVLKLEEVARWQTILLDSGLPVEGRSLGHDNRSDRSESDHLVRLKVSACEFDALKRQVAEAFKFDYMAFGYS